MRMEHFDKEKLVHGMAQEVEVWIRLYQVPMKIERIPNLRAAVDEGWPKKADRDKK